MIIRKILKLIAKSIIIILSFIPILITFIYFVFCDKIRVYLLNNLIIKNIIPIIKLSPYFNLYMNFSDAIYNKKLYSIQKELISGKITSKSPSLTITGSNYYKDQINSFPSFFKVYFKCTYEFGEEHYILDFKKFYIWEIWKIKKWVKEELSNKIKEIVIENVLIYDIFRHNIYYKIRNFNISSIKVFANYENYSHLNSIRSMVLNETTGYQCEVLLYSYYSRSIADCQDIITIENSSKKRKYPIVVYYKVKIIYKINYNKIYKEKIFFFKCNGKENLEDIGKKLESWIKIIDKDILLENFSQVLFKN